MKKVGLLSLVSFLISSLVGTGIFILPSIFGKYGLVGLNGWVGGAIFAMLMGLLFSFLHIEIPKLGGPYVYVTQVLGKSFGLFTGCSYWFAACFSNIMLIFTIVGFLSAIFGDLSKLQILLLEILVLSFVSIINCLGPKVVSLTQIGMVFFNLISLIVIPLFSLFNFNVENFIPINPTNENVLNIIRKTTFLAVWGFLGIEVAVVPAKSIENPRKNVPLAIFISTIIVFLLYISNNAAIMSLVPREDLMNSVSPYTDAVRILFSSQNITNVITIVGCVICFSALNSWTFINANISYNLANEKFFPKIFAIQNKLGAYYMSIFITYFATVIIFLLSYKMNITEQIKWVVNLSVVVMLSIYLICGFCLLKIQINKRKLGFKFFIALLSIIFCIWIIFSLEIKVILLSSIFLFLSLPFYFYAKKYDTKIFN